MNDEAVYRTAPATPGLLKKIGPNKKKEKNSLVNRPGDHIWVSFKKLAGEPWNQYKFNFA